MYVFVLSLFNNSVYAVLTVFPFTLVMTKHVWHWSWLRIIILFGKIVSVAVVFTKMLHEFEFYCGLLQQFVVSLYFITVLTQLPIKIFQNVFRLQDGLF